MLWGCIVAGWEAKPYTQPTIPSIPIKPESKVYFKCKDEFPRLRSFSRQREVYGYIARSTKSSPSVGEIVWCTMSVIPRLSSLFSVLARNGSITRSTNRRKKRVLFTFDPFPFIIWISGDDEGASTKYADLKSTSHWVGKLENGNN